MRKCFPAKDVFYGFPCYHCYMV